MNFGVTKKKQEELEARMAALELREEDFKSLSFAHLGRVDKG